MVRIRNLYPFCSVTLLVVSTVALPLFGQQNISRMLPPQPTAITEVKLTDFARPPHPIELVGMSLTPGGGLRYQTLMPIAGRMAATTDAAKLRGALAPPAGVYAYTAAVDASAQATPVSAAVFGPPDPRVKLAPDTPVDWAVWGTNNEDGPLRLPYGGGYDLLAAQLPPSVLVAQQLTQVSFGGGVTGFNVSNASMYPLYRTLTRFVDPSTGRIVSRREEIALQESVNRDKLPHHIPADGDTPQERGRVIAIAPTASGQRRFEGVATRYVESDKNSLYRNMSLLTFDEAGNLLKNLPIDLPYNRKLTMRLPVHNELGKAVGTFTVFADTPGKKTARDPQENRFSVVVTNELGEIWSRFEWTNGEGSSRAAIPVYVLRKGDKLLVFNTNQQKIFKPVDETWVFDQSGTARLVSSLTNGEIASHSTAIIDSPTNVFSREQLAEASNSGWAAFSEGRYLDSFTDATTGEVWLLLQRQADAPTASQSAPAAPESLGSRLQGFNKVMGQLTGKSAAVATPTEVEEGSGKLYSDVFVVHFDAELKFKDQTIINLETRPAPIAFTRSVRSTGTDYVFRNSVTTRLSIRGGRVSVQRLIPYESVRRTVPGADNFVIDETIGKIYVLHSIYNKLNLGKLLVYALD